MSGIGSGLGGYCAIAQGSDEGVGGSGASGATGPSEYYNSSYFMPPTRGVPVKSAEGVWNPHIVQGGPYIRYVSGSGVIDIGSANVTTWLDAQVTMTGDFMNTGMALMLAQAFGGLANTPAAGLAVAASPAYALMQGGATGASGSGGLYVQDGTWVDMELGVPSTDGTLHYQDYHAGKLTKAEWVFPRDNMVTFAYDWDFCYVAFPSTPAFIGTEPAGPVPFTMPNASSLFKVGGVAVDGCRKVTVTFTPKLAVDRIYVGQQYKEEPVSNGLIEIAVALEMDYTPTAKSNIFDAFLPHSALAVQITAVGNAISTSGLNDTFGITLPELLIQSGGEAPLKGVDIVNNTINLKGAISNAGTSPSAQLITGDTGW